MIDKCLLYEILFLMRVIFYQYSNLKTVLWASFCELFFSNFIVFILEKKVLKFNKNINR